MSFKEISKHAFELTESEVKRRSLHKEKIQEVEKLLIKVDDLWKCKVCVVKPLHLIEDPDYVKMQKPT